MANLLLDDLDFGMLELLEISDVAVEREEAPAVDDPRWYERTRELHRYLVKGPRSWQDLERWAAGQRVGHDEVRNQLVVLEQLGQAMAEGRGQNLTWRAKGYGAKRRGRA